MAPRSMVFTCLVGCSLAFSGSTAFADHVEWFNPLLAKVSGGAVVAGATPEALRIQHPGGASPVPGTVTIPLSVRSNGTVDSIYVCYRGAAGEFANTRITGIALRTMALPTATTTLLTDNAVHQNTTGECLGLNVADVAPFGAPDIVISYTLESMTFLEIGAIGIRLSNVVTAINDPMEPAAPSLSLEPSVPNPFSPNTRIAYGVTEPGHVRLQVVDVAGRVVRTLVDRTLASGQYSSVWDGRDQSGRPVAAGVYYSRVASDHQAQSQQMIRLK